MDPRHAVLFEPIQLGPKTLPNRFYQVPHASGFGVERPRTHAAFRGIKAEGGWGGVCVDYTAVSVESEESPAVSGLLWDEADAKALGLSADAIHAHGGLAGIELFHGGAGSPNGQSRAIRVAPSQHRSSPIWGGLAKEMDAGDITRVQREWADAARRARDVGFDIVYLYGAHGYLLSQFFSTHLNQRTDGYGGSLENRGRFWLETLDIVRDAVGADCAIATRIPISGGQTLPGVEIDDMLELIRMASPLVDLFDVNVGEWPEDSGTSRYYAEGHERPWTDRVREATDKPVVGVGRYTSADLMAEIVRTRALDIIGAARPAIADPFLPTKIAEGRLDEIRECTGSNVCIAREELYAQVGCIQNATAGEEFRRGWHPELFTKAANSDRAVLIVGAGPAGMECAVVLGKRGFDAVHLVDGAPEIGGRLRWARQLPTLGDWGRITDYRSIQLDKLESVEVITGRQLTAADICDYGAQIVIIATGSTWRGDGIQSDGADIEGADAARPNVLTPEQVMLEGKRPKAGTVVVYDADGYYVGPGIAEQLAGEGFDVHLVTPFTVVSPVSDESLEGDMLREHLHEQGITAHREVALTWIDEGGVRGTNQFGEPWTMPCSGVVLVTQQRSDNELYLELLADPSGLQAAGIEAVYAIGDAIAPRPISESIFDGHRLAREIDSDDPMRPLPYLREPAAT